MGCFENLSKYKDDININPDKKIISQMVKSVIQLLIEIMRLTIFFLSKKKPKQNCKTLSTNENIAETFTGLSKL